MNAFALGRKSAPSQASKSLAGQEKKRKKKKTSGLAAVAAASNFLVASAIFFYWLFFSSLYLLLCFVLLKACQRPVVCARVCNVYTQLEKTVR